MFFQYTDLAGVVTASSCLSLQPDDLHFGLYREVNALKTQFSVWEHVMSNLSSASYCTFL